MNDLNAYFVDDKKALKVKTELHGGEMFLYINDIMILSIDPTGYIKFSYCVNVNESMINAQIDMKDVLK